MTTPRVDLRNPWLAALLAFLVPGAGHLYQRRNFKAAIYFVGILGLFLSGLALGEWKTVYWRWEPGGHRTFGYLSQVLVGLPALPARFQSMRYTPPPDNLSEQDRRLRLDLIKDSDVDAKLQAPFVGRFRYLPGTHDAIQPEDGAVTPAEPIVDVTGHIEWTSQDGKFVGTFEGQTTDGRSLSLKLADVSPTITPRVFAHGEITQTELRKDGDPQKKVFSNSFRYLHVDLTDGERLCEIEGRVPRSFWDWYQAPLENKALGEIHGRLGRRYDLAQVFTWIAGLLNLLAIWDAFGGPAYGYGDEEEMVETGEAVGGTS